MITEVIKRTFPPGLQRRLNDAVYAFLGLRYRLMSGVEIYIGSKTDWLSFNGIFLSGDYDSAILPLRTHSGKGAVVLDLGCNTGYFALRCLDALGREAFHGKFEWIAVDASDTMLGAYRKRVLVTNGLEGRIKVVRGLVGRRSGAADFFESTNNGANTCIPEHTERDRRYSRRPVPFVDVGKVIPAGPIALIKCDIEGSEGDFIRSYPDLLERTESLIFEFHDCCGDQDALFECLRSAGFERRTIRPNTGTSIEFFKRAG